MANLRYRMIPQKPMILGCESVPSWPNSCQNVANSHYPKKVQLDRFETKAVVGLLVPGNIGWPCPAINKLFQKPMVISYHSQQLKRGTLQTPGLPAEDPANPITCSNHCLNYKVGTIGTPILDLKNPGLGPSSLTKNVGKTDLGLDPA